MASLEGCLDPKYVERNAAIPAIMATVEYAGRSGLLVRMPRMLMPSAPIWLSRDANGQEAYSLAALKITGIFKDAAAEGFRPSDYLTPAIDVSAAGKAVSGAARDAKH